MEWSKECHGPPLLRTECLEVVEPTYQERPAVALRIAWKWPKIPKVYLTLAINFLVKAPSGLTVWDAGLNYTNAVGFVCCISHCRMTNSWSGVCMLLCAINMSSRDRKSRDRKEENADQAEDGRQGRYPFPTAGDSPAAARPLRGGRLRVLLPRKELHPPKGF